MKGITQICEIPKCPRLKELEWDEDSPPDRVINPKDGGTSWILKHGTTKRKDFCAYHEREREKKEALFNPIRDTSTL